MISFKPLTPADMPLYDRYLKSGEPRGCEYSFANLYIWGRQAGAFLGDRLVLFSQFDGKSVYPFPVGPGPLKPVVEAIMDDARQRGIPCRITGLVRDEIRQLEELFPGRWRYHCARDSFDYVYDIDDLADLKGKKYQPKRNYVNRFWNSHPDCRTEPITGENLDQVKAFVRAWYERRLEEDPYADVHMERAALNKAMAHREELAMEGLVLVEQGQILAMTLGTGLSADTYDVNFEKAWAHVDGAYAAVNREFARYIRQRHPRIRFLNREDDVGLEGLRKAKLSYKPHHLLEKCWACLLEEGYEY